MGVGSVIPHQALGLSPSAFNTNVGRSAGLLWLLFQYVFCFVLHVPPFGFTECFWRLPFGFRSSYFSIFFFNLFCLFLRGRERERTWGRGRERGRKAPW